MKWTGVTSVVLLTCVTHCAGLSCYTCYYNITIGGGETVAYGNKLCEGTDPSKYTAETCNVAQVYCRHQVWTRTFTQSGKEFNAGVKRGCSYQKTGTGCTNTSLSINFETYSSESCLCNKNHCNGKPSKLLLNSASPLTLSQATVMTVVFLLVFINFQH